MVAKTEKNKAQISATPKDAPALAEVVTVPGPIKAAAMMDQKRMLERPFRKDKVLAMWVYFLY